jgi:hypothetical protein
MCAWLPVGVRGAVLHLACSWTTASSAAGRSLAQQEPGLACLSALQWLSVPCDQSCVIPRLDNLAISHYATPISCGIYVSCLVRWGGRGLHSCCCVFAALQLCCLACTVYQWVCRMFITCISRWTAFIITRLVPSYQAGSLTGLCHLQRAVRPQSACGQHAQMQVCYDLRVAASIRQTAAWGWLNYKAR